jgi:hypothetical protein
VIAIRGNSGLETSGLAPIVAESCLRLLSCSDELIAEAVLEAKALL